MHLIETYALATGSKIGKPFIFKKFFPIPFEKYITIQNSSGMQGKCYDYFQEVIDFIFEDLEQAGYKIVQIGSKDDKPIKNALHLQGQTNINQTAFILENSKLHIGNDSFAIHMCSAFDIPLIGLYSVSSPEIAGPFWKNSKQICLTPDNWKPSFNPNENPKRVNEIKIEKIINSIQELINISSKNNIKTIFIGPKYKHGILEVMPEQIVHNQFFQNHPLNIRYDFITNRELEAKDYQGTINNLNIRECAIVTDKVLAIENFLQLKQKLSLVVYDITKSIDTSFLEKLIFYGINTRCVFKNFEGSNEELLNRKESLIDFPQIIEEINLPEFDKNLITEDCFYKTNKFFIADNKIFLGRHGYLNNNPLQDSDKQNYQKINTEYLNDYITHDLEYSLIFKKD